MPGVRRDDMLLELLGDRQETARLVGGIDLEAGGLRRAANSSSEQ